MRRPQLLLSPAFLLLPLVAACDASSGASREQAERDYQNCLTSESASLRATSEAAAAPKGPFSASLLATTPAAVSSLLRDSMKTSMRQQLDNARIHRLATLRCDYLKPPPQRSTDDYAAESANAGGDPSGGASQVSTTNNQVVGVDEADFVKNDNKYIYVVNGSRFRIIQAWPATSAHEVASIPVNGTAKKLFVEGNRAVVYSSTPSTRPSSGYGSGNGYGEGGHVSDCTYGQSGCVPSGDGTETEIAIFDIANRNAPALVRAIHSSSSFIAARRIGNAVHTVLGEPPAVGTSWDTIPNGLGNADEATINSAYAALVAENTKHIDAIQVGDVLPKWTDSASQGPELQLFQSSIPDGAAFTSLLSLDLASNDNVKVASIISSPGWVYASAGSLYMAVPHQQLTGWGWFEGRSEPELSTVHKFTIGAAPGTTAYAASGIVKGRVLNQFAMDEKDGFLRVATTTGHLPDPSAHNTLSIFEDKGGKLEVVGAIDNIAPTEDIRSVRFDGDRGFVVTFKKTDPLFVFDLANPHAPKTLGELKIPGFSTYMHMMDATHLLTIGYDAADQGDFAYFTGLILQIFDVTDPKNPTLAHKETIGTRGSSSEAATNHLAFNFFAPKGLLALPMTVCEGGDTNGNYGTQMTFSGLMVYDTSVANGFHLRGKVAHPNAASGAENDYGYYDSGCSNWWSNASSEVKRSIFMDDYVFSVSASRIKVNQLDNLAVDVKELSIQ